MRAGAVIIAALLLAACDVNAARQQAEAAKAAAVRAAGQRRLDAESAASGLGARAAAAKQAADRFVALAGPSAATGQPPRQTDAAAAPLLDAVFDTTAIPMFTGTLADTKAFGVWGDAVTEAGQVYVFAGTGVTDMDATPSDAAKARTARNFVTYGPELGRFLDAEVVLASREGSTLEYVRATGNLNDNDRAAVTQDIQKVSQVYAEVLGLIARTGPTDAWKEARARVLTTMAPRVSSSLEPAVAASVQRQAQAVAAATDDATLKAQLLALADRF